MDNSSVVNVLLKVNGRDVEKQYEKLTKTIEQCNKEKKKLEEKHADGTIWSAKDKAAAKALEKELTSARKSLERMTANAKTAGEVLDNLSSSSVQRLTKTLKSLEKAQSKVGRGTKEWDDLSDAIRRVKGELSAVKEETAAAKTGPVVTAGEMGQLAKDIVRFTGNMVDSYAEYAEAQANVSKYTGLSTEEVKALNEELKKIDTRSSILQLNALAADAGRLGISSKQQILEFVEAADMINVALGEDLGEDAVKNLGKLSSLFGEVDRLGMKGALLSTGSAINELGSKSVASEAAIMDFTARIGGMGKVSNMTQAEIMGLASVLDAGVVSAEKGSTALSGFIQKMYTNPTLFAEKLGIEVDLLNKKLKEGGNAALLTILEKAKSLGGISAIAPILKELSISGAGVTQMFTTLTEKYDDVIKNQALANTAYTEAVSIINESNLANNTAAANLEKNRNKVEELKYSIGESLYPVYIDLLEALSSCASSVSVVTKFLNENRAVLYLLVAVIGTYTSALAFAGLKAAFLKAQEVLLLSTQKALTLTMTAGRLAVGALNVAYIALTKGMNAARVASAALKASMAGTPWGAALVAVGLVVSAITAYAAKLFSANEEEKKHAAALTRIGRLEQQAAQDADRQAAHVKSLSQILHDNTQKIDSRRAALSELQRLVPSYHASLTTEGRLINDNTAALEEYIKGLQKASMVRVAEKELDRLNERVFTLTRNKKGDRAEAWLKRNQAKYEKLSKDIETARRYDVMDAIREKDIEWVWAYEEQLRKFNSIQSALRQTEDEIEETKKIIAGSGVTLDFGGNEIKGSNDLEGFNGSNNLKSPKSPKSSPADLISERVEREIVAARLAYQAGLTTYLEYEEAEKKITRRGIDERLALYKEGTKEYESVKKEEADWNERHGETAAARSKGQIENNYNALAALARYNLECRLVDEEQYGRMMADAERRRLKERVAYARKYGSRKDILAAEKALQDNADREREESRRRLMERLSKLKQRYEIKDKDDTIGTLEEEIAGATALLAALNVPLEEQARILDAIRNNYAAIKNENEGTKEEEKLEVAIGSPTDAFSQAFIALANNIRAVRQTLKTEGKAGWDEYAAVATSAIGMVTAAMQSAQELIRANQEEEIAEIEARYERQIKAAGENSEEAKRLEEEKNAEIEKTKAKYAEKEFKMQLAMAIAQTAQNALMAFGAMAGIAVVGPALGAAAAAMALAAGAIQIAAIRKQKEAAGYFTGGYTGGKEYRKEAGVVHQGEFVANHAAVNNPALRPMLDVIDRAQRSNTVSSLTAEDVTRAVSRPAALAAALPAARTPAPVVITKSDPETTAAIARLDDTIRKGITAVVSIDGRDGVAYNLERYNKMIEE